MFHFLFSESFVVAFARFFGKFLVAVWLAMAYSLGCGFLFAPSRGEFVMRVFNHLG